MGHVSPSPDPRSPLNDPPRGTVGSAPGHDWLGHLYSELHSIAERCFRSERREHTLQPTALVHEAMIRLSGYRSPDGQASSDQNLLALAAIVMRRVLVDHARRRRSRIKGVQASTLIAVESSDSSSQTPMDVLAFDEMLERLSRIDSRASHIIELRFFGGLTVAETAEFLSLSISTVEADSRFALAWMRRDLSEEEPRPANL